MSYPALIIQLVKLASDEYSVPNGTLGYVDEAFEPQDTCAVTWVHDPGPGGGSVPVLLAHLEPVARLSVRIPRELIDEEIARAQIDIPSWLIRARARQLTSDVAKVIDAAEETAEAL
jgi:hypothetical protein